MEQDTAPVVKPGLLKRIFRFIKWSIILFLASTILVTILYRFINPPVTPLMMIRVVEQLADNEKPRLIKDWVALEDISDNMKLAVIASEDNNFESHFGVDFKAIKKANKLNKKGKKLRGASTITQQTAKNVFLWPDRTWVRKGLELYFTGLIEVFWGKKRIMEVYLNVIEMGTGIYGVEEAAQTYFKKSASRLSRSEAAAIAAVLPNPLRWRPDKPTSYIQKKKGWIQWNMNNVVKPEW
ncbi:MAG: monofunctional biosynthetic peptidoglycan transglycosylase [Bacteroidales bacterium]|nr:monofunctional biosynthetic peptidoglycan transglycosylase [Bacteroidales bacterium]